MKPWIMRPVVGWVPDRWALVKLDCGHVARFMAKQLRDLAALVEPKK